MKTKNYFLSLAIACLLFWSFGASATNFTVTNNADTGAGSLRQAITSANADNTATAIAPHTITTDAAYSISLATALPAIANHININSSGTNVLTITATSGVRPISISAGKTVTLNYLTIQNCVYAADHGGAIYNDGGFTTINNCTFTNNSVQAANKAGGAIINCPNGANIGSLTISNSTFTSNKANNGGAIQNEYGPLTLTNCTFDANSGLAGGLGSAIKINRAYALNMTGCVVKNNTGTAAIYDPQTAVISISNCIIKDNTSATTAGVSAAGLTVAGNTTITNCVISGNSITGGANKGAGLCILTSLAATGNNCTVTGTTISGNTNSSNTGGGVSVQSGSTVSIVFTNCTISGNSATGTNDGGGLRIDSPTTLNNCTITGNSSKTSTPTTAVGGGIFNNSSLVTLNYCILAGNNTASTDVKKDFNNNQLTTTLTSTTGRNLTGGTVTFGATTPAAVTTGNVITTDISTVLNTTLADNGGTTALPEGGYVKTHALVNASAAFNPTAAASGLQTTDQRGKTRDATPDMGAVELLVADAPTIGIVAPGNAQASVAFVAPANDGGSAITGYTATSSPGGFTGTGTASPISVTGLTNGTAYTFTVTATNAVGNSAASAPSSEVTPATLPDAPTAVEATRGNGEVSVAFTAPVSDGGSAITDYTVTSSPGNFTATGAISPLTVTGLTNGTVYTFTVIATNAVGNSVESALSSEVTPATVPEAPTAIDATAGDGEVSVAFTAPVSDGGSVITDYTVTSSPGNFTATGAISPLTVTGLTNGTVYTFTVIATNAVGNSVESALSSEVTPATVPEAPTAIDATAGDGEASVSFDAPVSNGGSVITGYTVTSDPEGITATGTSSPITITGLTNGVEYTFIVLATNALGDGLSSVSSNAVTPDLGTSIKNPLSTLAVHQAGSDIILNLSGLAGIQTVSITDAQGKTVISRQVVGGTKVSVTNNLNNGLYIVKVQGSEKTLTSKLMLK